MASLRYLAEGTAIWAEENLMQHVQAASDLWRTQQSMGISNAENSWHGGSLRGLREEAPSREARAREKLVLYKVDG